MGARLIYQGTLATGVDPVDALAVVSLAPENPFFGMPYDAAVEHFRSREVVTPEEFDLLRDRYKSAGFIARKLATDAQVRRVRELILERLEGPDGPSEVDVITDLEEEFGTQFAAPDHYVRLVTRNAVSTSYMAGRWQEMNRPTAIKLRPYGQYLTARDSRVRDAHRALSDVVVELGTSFAAEIAPPLDHNCFLPGTRVDGEVLLATRGVYHGKAVEVVTESGRTLRVTPNHRVATPQGFVAVKDLEEGDDLICRPIDVEPGRSVDDHYVPPRIEEVFDAVSERSPTRRARVVGDDFHGDGGGFDGEVHVVPVDGLLLDRLDAASGERVTEFGLAGCDVGEEPFAVEGSSVEFDVGGDSPATRTVRRSDLTRDGDRVLLEGLPLQTIRIGPASSIHAMLSQDAGYDAAADAEFLGELLLAHPSEVEVDRVVSVREFDWSGHVYDLQSPGGWVVASGVYASNCRCSMRTLSAAQWKKMQAELGKTLTLAWPTYVDARGRQHVARPGAGWEHAPDVLASLA